MRYGDDAGRGGGGDAGALREPVDATPARRLPPDALARLRPLIAEDNAALGLRIGDRYEVRRRIASGGMGDVFHAHDLRLDRPVAMKVLGRAVAKAGWAARFQAEARTTGKIDHPGIVPVHDLGDLPDGRLYYTMKYVEGRTLEERAPVATRVKALAAACRIVQHAHERGVIHRDLKPANIMIAASGQVFVIDWGIARVHDELREACGEGATLPPAATAAGALLGTVAYMSPEQARGDLARIDARSDVYSLGAILYEILVGMPPIGGLGATSMIELAKLACPRRPREVDPRVPPDLEAICLKAMEPRPEQRYARAAELADDLERYLAGDPVSARAPGLLEGLVRRARRRKAALAGTGAALAVVLIVLLALRQTTADLGRTRESLVTQLTRTSDACLDAAIAMRRVGNLDGMAQYVRKLDAACQEAIRAAPDIAEPYHLLGRMRRAEMHFDDALAQQEEALRRQPDHAGARYERGMLRHRKFLERMEVLRDRWRRDLGASLAGERGGATRPPPPAELEDDAAREWKRLALQDLEGLDHPVARAFVAGIRGDRDAACDILKRAIAESPDLTDAYEWLGGVAQREGRFDEAAAWYSKGIERDRGFLPYREARAQVRRTAGDARLARGDDPTGDYAASIADWDALAAIRPQVALYPRARGGVHLHVALFVEGRGGDPSESYAKAQADLDRAIEADPRDAATIESRGILHANMSAYLHDRSSDPSTHLDRAVEDFTEALRIDPDRRRLHVLRAGVLANRANLEMSLRRDPTPTFRRALEDLDRAIVLDPVSAEPRRQRGFLMHAWGYFEMSTRQDATARFEEALADFDEALRLDAKEVRACVGRGAVCLNLAMMAMGRRADPIPRLRQAVAAYDRALETNRACQEALMGRGNARAAWMDHLVRSGVTPSEEAEQPHQLYAALKADFGEAVRLNPRDPEAWWRRGQAHYVMGAWREALADFEEAGSIRPDLRAGLRMMVEECRRRLARE